MNKNDSFGNGLSPSYDFVAKPRIGKSKTYVNLSVVEVYETEHIFDMFESNNLIEDSLK